jgi:two-component system, NtrC family, response regulator AtoC
MGESVLVVDDEDVILGMLSGGLSAAGYEVHCARSGEEALGALQTDRSFAAVVLDYCLPDVSGLELLRRVKARNPEARVIVMTGYSTVELAVNAMKLGADEFLTKPVQPEALARMVGDLARAEPGPKVAEEAQGAPPPQMLGTSRSTAQLRELVARVAQSRAPTVLLTGESGTGKDLVARTLHALGPRASRPFTNITCSALPENLLESELFGHEAGAFTNATRLKRGLLELSDGGTVFLDEVSEMTPALQAKLLRFIEERAFRRLGSSKDIRVDVRIVAASNRDLDAAILDGSFRADLYYRLRVVPIHLPPLRERREDIEALSRAFLACFNRSLGCRVEGFAADALRALQQYSWPGNVRELKHTIERAVLLCDGMLVRACDLNLIESTSGTCLFRLPPDGVVLEQVERSLLEQALEVTGWNQVRAGKLLGLNRDQVRYRIEKFSLERRSGYAA